MLQGELLTITNNKDYSNEEKYTISNIFKDKSQFEDEKSLNIPYEKEKNIKKIKVKKDFKTRNEKNKSLKLQEIEKGVNNNKNYQDLVDNPSDNTNNNFKSTFYLKKINEDVIKNLFDKNNYNENIDRESDEKTNANEDNVKIFINKKQKKTKRVKFKTQFLNIVEIESYKSFNANMCFSDLEFVDTAERKSLCKELCSIL